VPQVVAPLADAAPASAAQHLERLQVLCTPAAPAERPRGSNWQEPRRRLEQQVRQEGVAFRQWVAAYGLNRMDSAACLGIKARTLRQWEGASTTLSLAWALRGRPVVRSERALRTAVLGLLESVGPGVGLAVLQGQFPEMPRAELADLLRRYRRVWQRRHQQALHVLHWPSPGVVWAMDYAKPPLPLEEGFTDVLAVRDLASGYQLLWLPVEAATAATTVAALLWLFTLYGAPVVLKMDNGSPFVAAATQALLGQWQVVPLFSPPGWPAYNGAIEAGIGALKARTHYQAARQGHPGEWTLADLEAAREAANTLGRPWGAHRPTPAVRWAEHQVGTAAERHAFAQTVARLEEEAAPPAAAGTAAPPALAGAPHQATSSSPVERAGPPAAEAAPAADQAAGPARPPDQARSATAAPPPEIHREDRPCGASGQATEGGRPSPARAAQRREAISRALVAHGYLLFTRRRIPLPITRKKVPKIT
jgi:hypothetical protein